MTSIYEIEMMPLKGKVDYLRENEAKYSDDLRASIEHALREYDNSLRARTKSQRVMRLIDYLMINATFLGGFLANDEPNPSTDEFRQEYLKDNRSEDLISLDSVLESPLESKIDNIKRYITRYPEDAHFYTVLLNRFNNDWATEAELANAVGRILKTTNRLSLPDKRRVTSGVFLEEARQRPYSDVFEEVLPRDSIRLILTNFISDGNAICAFLKSSKWVYEIASEPSVLASLKESVLADRSRDNKKLIETEYTDRDDFIDWYESNFYTRSCRISDYVCNVNAFYYKDYERLQMMKGDLQIKAVRKISSLIDAKVHEEEPFLDLVRYFKTKTIGLASAAMSEMVGIYTKSLVENYGSCDEFLRLLTEDEAKSYFRMVRTQFLLKSKHVVFRRLLESGISVYGVGKFIPLLAINEKSIPKKETLLIIKELFTTKSWNAYVKKYRPFVESVYNSLRKVRKPLYGLTLSDGWDLLQVLSVHN